MNYEIEEMRLRDNLRGLGCVERSDRLILSGFSVEFYLVFNVENSGYLGTCDVYVVPIGSDPISGAKIRLIKGADWGAVKSLLTLLSVMKAEKGDGCSHVWEKQANGNYRYYINGLNSYIVCEKCGQRKRA